MARHRCLKICCFVTAAILFIFTIVILTLALTIFKPKQPDITAHPVGLENIDFNGTFPGNITLDVTLKIVVTIDNPNYGSFECSNSTGYIYYRGGVVAEVPIGHELVQARARVNMTTTADLSADKLVLNPSFWDDLETGRLNMTSTASLHGKVTVMKVLKLHATAFSQCNISIFIQTRDIESKCNSRIKF